MTAKIYFESLLSVLVCCYFNNMKFLLFSLLFAASCLYAETDTNLYDRVFFLQPPISDGLRAAREHPLSSEEMNKKLMSYFQDYHNIQWPEGSELVKNDDEWCNHIYVRNTRQQLSKMEAGIAKCDLSVVLRFPVEIALIAFQKEDIEHLQTSGTLTAEGLMKLQKRGRSRPLSILKPTNRCGQESTIKDTQEFIYPSDYFTENSITNSKCEEFTVLLPVDFTTKDVGTICSVVLESSCNDDGLFTVSTQITHTTLKGWASFESILVNKCGVRKETNAQPLFTCLSISGKQVIRPKETVLVGGGRLDDEWVAYALVTLDTPLSVERNEIRSTQKLTKEVAK
jgi:hypothetical protein